MARNGSGTMILDNGVHQGATTFEQDRDAGTNILASRVDYALQDICNAMTQSIATDGQSIVTANIPMGGYRITGLANGTGLLDASNISQLQSGAVSYAGVGAGTANVQTAALSPVIAAYVDGAVYRYLPFVANTGASTLNINGVGAKSIVKWDTQVDLDANDLLTTVVAQVIYLSGIDKFILLNPQSSGKVWSPGVIATSGGTLTNISYGTRSYAKEGKRVTCILTVGFDVITADVPSITYTLPTTAAVDIVGSGYAFGDGALGIVGGYSYAATATTGIIVAQGSLFKVGVSRFFGISITYAE